LGRAAIAFRQVEAGIGSIGGLVSSWNSRAIANFSMAYIGAIAFESRGLRRESGSVLGKSEVESWASQQARLLTQSEINDLEKYLAAINVAEFGGDSTPIAMILINRQPTSLLSAYELLADGQVIFAAAEPSAGIQSKSLSISHVMHWQNPGFGSSLGWAELDFVVTTMEAWSGRHMPDQIYHRIPTDEAAEPSCFLSCLKRYVQSRGHTLRLEFIRDALFGRYKGEESPRQKLFKGTELRGFALKLSLSREVR